MSPARPLPPRDTRGPTPLSQCAPVADLAARAREVERLSQRIVPLLPTPLRDHTGFAGVRNDHVLLLVDSPVWATRVRMHQSHILSSIRSLGVAATSVTARVVPSESSYGPPAAAPVASPRTAQTIRAAARAISDPDLRASFLDLARLAEGPPTA